MASKILVKKKTNFLFVYESIIYPIYAKIGNLKCLPLIKT